MIKAIVFDFDHTLYDRRAVYHNMIGVYREHFGDELPENLSDAELADALADAFESMALDERADELYMSGTSHLAHSRSLADLAPLFDALEEQVVLMKLMSNLSEETNASGVGVAIGSEMHTPGLLHASVVSSGYGRSGAAGEPAGNDPVGEPETESETESQTNDTEPIAFVGSIGPTHMDYAATMAAVRAVARYLTAFLSEGRTQD